MIRHCSDPDPPEERARADLRWRRRLHETCWNSVLFSALLAAAEPARPSNPVRGRDLLARRTVVMIVVHVRVRRIARVIRGNLAHHIPPHPAESRPSLELYGWGVTPFAKATARARPKDSWSCLRQLSQVRRIVQAAPLGRATPRLRSGDRQRRSGSRWSAGARPSASSNRCVVARADRPRAFVRAIPSGPVTGCSARAATRPIIELMFGRDRHACRQATVAHRGADGAR